MQNEEIQSGEIKRSKLGEHLAHIDDQISIERMTGTVEIYLLLGALYVIWLKTQNLWAMLIGVLIAIAVAIRFARNSVEELDRQASGETDRWWIGLLLRIAAVATMSYGVWSIARDFAASQ